MLQEADDLKIEKKAFDEEKFQRFFKSFIEAFIYFYKLIIAISLISVLITLLLFFRHWGYDFVGLCVASIFIASEASYLQLIAYFPATWISNDPFDQSYVILAPVVTYFFYSFHRISVLRGKASKIRCFFASFTAVAILMLIQTIGFATIAFYYFEA